MILVGRDAQFGRIIATFCRTQSYTLDEMRCESQLLRAGVIFGRRSGTDTSDPAGEFSAGFALWGVGGVII